MAEPAALFPSRLRLSVPPTCKALVSHAAQDNTQTYLALLPADVRHQVDLFVRRVEWPHTGLLRTLQLPEGIEFIERAAWAATAENEAVLIVVSHSPVVRVVITQRSA